MIDDIFIFDNIIDSKAQKQIQHIVFDKIRWQFIADVTNPNNKQQRPGFSYHFLKDNKTVFDYHSDMIQMIDAACDKINFKREDCLQGRSFLQLPLNLKDRSIDVPHVDADIEHLVILYYVNDSDGDTIIYDYKSKNENDIPYFENIKEQKRIKPKQGRVVVFDGLYWHTAEQPRNDIRCIININLNET